MQVSVVGDTVNVAGQASGTPIKVSDSRLSDDLGSLLEREQFCDVTLSVDGCEFRAHKALLAGQLRFVLKSCFVCGCWLCMMSTVEFEILELSVSKRNLFTSSHRSYSTLSTVNTEMGDFAHYHLGVPPATHANSARPFFRG